MLGSRNQYNTQKNKGTLSQSLVSAPSALPAAHCAWFCTSTTLSATTRCGSCSHTCSTHVQQTSVACAAPGCGSRSMWRVCGCARAAVRAQRRAPERRWWGVGSVGSSGPPAQGVVWVALGPHSSVMHESQWSLSQWSLSQSSLSQWSLLLVHQPCMC